MIRKYSIAGGITISLALLLIATTYYPGGSQDDPHSIGFSWKNNYISNLFAAKAGNGAGNPARPWAVTGVFFLCSSCAVFFWQFSKKIPSKNAAGIIRYVGAVSMLFAFLAVTPYHDLMVMLSGTGALLTMFYITVFLFKSRWLFMKFFSLICLLIFYTCNYIYYTRNFLALLPVVQKTLLVLTVSWILCLQHFSTSADFQDRKNNQPANQ